MSQRCQWMVFALLFSLCFAQKPDNVQVETTLRACVASCRRELQLVHPNANKGNNLSLKPSKAVKAVPPVRENIQRKKPVSVTQFQGLVGLRASLDSVSRCENKCKNKLPNYMCFCRESKCFPTWGCKCIKWLCEGPHHKTNGDHGKGRVI